MRYLFLLCFFGLSFTAFSANNLSDLPFEELDNLKRSESSIKLNSNDSKEPVVAFECYYTVEWLYIDSPFIKKFEVLA